MKSLDELLSERAQGLFKHQLAEALDPGTWNPENRLDKLKQTREISEAVATEATRFVDELATTKVYEQSLLWWKVMEQFIVAELELLINFRNELDTTPSELLSSLPVDYEFLNSEIRARHQELESLALEMSKAMSDTGSVEEI